MITYNTIKAAFKDGNGTALPAAEFTPGVYAEPVTNETAYIFNTENLPA